MKVSQQELMESFENPLKFWLAKESLFPNLCKVALQILCIPATSCEPERTFSLSGNVVNDKRSRLDPKNVGMIVEMNKRKHFD